MVFLSLAAGGLHSTPVYPAAASQQGFQTPGTLRVRRANIVASRSLLSVHLAHATSDLGRRLEGLQERVPGGCITPGTGEGWAKIWIFERYDTMTFSRRRITTAYGLCNILARSLAVPSVAFPFNSQVPTVARVGQPYSFQFSASTFAPDTTNFTYSLSEQAAWLSLDSATRTISGAPSQADVGASRFLLTAADSSGAAQMPCTLVVSTDPPPQLEWDISTQLAATANLSSIQPPVATVLPSTQLHFDFRQDSFIDIVRRKLYYYATLSDHTPLPSWLIFDPQSLVFSGIAPQLSAFPQSWNIDLIASDVEGFAGAAASFTIAIGTQQLVFVPNEQEVNVTAGANMDYTGLQDTLFRNGARVNAGTMNSAHASVPPWLSFNPTTLELSGTAPTDFAGQNVTITVVDDAGTQATAVVSLLSGKERLISRAVGTLTARAGTMFNYHFPDSLFTDQDVNLMITLPETARWLSFDAATRNLSGHVPTQTTSSFIQATLTAKSAEVAQPQKQVFAIDIEAGKRYDPASSKVLSPSSSTNAPTMGATAAGAEPKRHSHLTSGVIAGIVVATVLVAAVLAAFLVLCWRRRRHQGYIQATSPNKRTISKPMLPPDADGIVVTTDVQTDIEKSADTRPYGPQSRNIEQPPQISLDLPSQATSKRFKWSKRFSRISQASSLGNGEDAIRADSNIPELGGNSTLLHTPHDSFSVPAELARLSKAPEELSPSKRALRRLRDKRQSRQSVGLGIDTGGAGLLPRHSTRSGRSHRKAASSMGLSTTQDRSSVASLSTRGTSVLSTRPSEFPRPPTRSTLAGSRSVPTLSLTEAEKRRSIRLVDRSDSIADHRSLEDKRRSFIRNRASTSLASPLFAHGSRASSGAPQDGRASANELSTNRHRRSRRGQSGITTYSESSSLEPPPKDPRRLSARLRSAFAPSFPRALTRSSLGADDEGGAQNAESDWESYSTSSSTREANLAAQLALPRHQRNFVLPGEASPTPPPAPPTSRQASTGRDRSSPGDGEAPRQKWRDRLRERSSSPLSTAVAVPLADLSPNAEIAKSSQARRSRLSEPISLVSNDSLSRTKLERPRLVQTNSKRPVSVEKVHRLSSLRAEAEDTRPGSEVWEAMEGAGLMPPNSSNGKEGTQKSNMSGPAFL